MTCWKINEESYCTNEELNRIKNWCNDNKLTLNLDRTNYIINRNPQNIFVLSKEIGMHNAQSYM